MGLTDLLIRKLKPPKKGQKTYFDDVLPGFGVRVSQGGTKTFVLKYGKKRNLKTLGRYPSLSLADARRQAKRVQGELLSAPVLLSTIPEIAFNQARDQFLKDSAIRTKPSTYGEYDRLLRKHFSFNKNLSTITRQDITKAVRVLSDKPSIEQHAFVAIRTMMNWCVRHGLLEKSPVPPLKYQSKARSRILSDEELRIVWKRAEEYGYPYGRIVQFLILTGQRRGEIAGLQWEWINDDEIVYPQGFTKNKREHHVPIGPLTKRILEELPQLTENVFPARTSTGTTFSGWSKSKRHFDEPLDISPYTLHDLRRTYSSNLAKLGVPIHVTEKLLNHVSGSISGVAAVYNRHTYMEEMREAVANFDSYLANLIRE